MDLVELNEYISKNLSSLDSRTLEFIKTIIIHYKNIEKLKMILKKPYFGVREISVLNI